MNWRVREAHKENDEGEYDDEGEQKKIASRDNKKTSEMEVKL